MAKPNAAFSTGGKQDTAAIAALPRMSPAVAAAVFLKAKVANLPKTFKVYGPVYWLTLDLASGRLL